MESNHLGVFYFVAACGAGILFRSFFDWGHTVVILVVVLALVVTIIFALTKARAVFLLALVLFAFAVGALRMEWDVRERADPTLRTFVGETVEMEGVVNAEPDLRDRNQLVRIGVESVFEEGARDNVLISVDSHIPLSYGDRVMVKGALQLPENFETESGKIFNYVEYLAKEGVHFRMLYPELEVLGRGGGNPILRGLFTFKERALEELADVIPEPEVSLLGGLLVGAKQSLGEELLQMFRATGLIHIVVLSGYNMSLVAEGLKHLFSFLPALWGTIFGASGIVLFTLMAGASAATVRASIMALLVLLASRTGRVYDVTRALTIAAFLMIMHNPRIVAFDPGFQLSFIATLGLIHGAPLLARYVPFLPERSPLRSLLAATIATQLSVLPLLLYQTGSISLVAVFANLFVLPLIPLAMLLGSFTGLISFLNDTAAYPFALLSDAVLSYILVVAELFSAVPYGALSVTSVSFLGVVLLYATGILLFILLRKRSASSAQNFVA